MSAAGAIRARAGGGHVGRLLHALPQRRQRIRGAVPHHAGRPVSQSVSRPRFRAFYPRRFFVMLMLLFAVVAVRCSAVLLVYATVADGDMASILFHE